MDYFLFLLMALLAFLAGKQAADNNNKKHQAPTDDKLKKDLEYNKNLNTSLLHDVTELRKKNNDLLEKNWKLEQEIKKYEKNV
jgi:peptidoglycan hydrolase CwlO-like protein